MSQPVFRNSAIVGGRACGLALALLVAPVAAPAAAQMFSDGHAFLEAVRDADGDKVMQIVSQPGSTIVNTRDLATGDTALHIVTARQDAVWMRFLTQKGANANTPNKKGITPLMIAAGHGHVEGVEVLLKAGARIDEQNSLGETPLISATHRRDIEMVRLLLANGADPDRNDNSGRSARDYVEAMGNKRLIDEFAAADAKRQGQSGPSYGPGL